MSLVESLEEWDNEGGNVLESDKNKELKFTLET